MKAVTKRFIIYIIVTTALVAICTVLEYMAPIIAATVWVLNSKRDGER